VSRGYTGCVAVINAPELELNWIMRVVHAPAEPAPRPPEVAREAIPHLRRLERSGRRAFNCFPAHYEDPPAPPIAEAVRELRSLGATAGLAREHVPGAPATVDVRLGVAEPDEPAD